MVEIPIEVRARIVNEAEIKRQAKEIVEGVQGGAGDLFAGALPQKKGGGGAGGEVLGMVGKAAAPVAIVGGALELLKKINDGIKGAIDSFTQASDFLRESRDLLQKSFNFGLRPIADLMGLLLLPISKTMIMLGQQFQKAVTEEGLIEQATGATNAGATADVFDKMFQLWDEIVMAPLQEAFPNIGRVLSDFGVDVTKTSDDMKIFAGDSIGGLTSSFGNIIEKMNPFISVVDSLSASSLIAREALDIFQAETDSIGKEGGTLPKFNETLTTTASEIATSGGTAAQELGKLSNAIIKRVEQKWQ